MDEPQFVVSITIKIVLADAKMSIPN